MNGAAANPNPGVSIKQNDVNALLKVAKGSRIVPLLLLAVAIFAFVAFWLPPGRTLLVSEFTRMCQSVRPDTGSLPGLVGLVVANPEPAKSSAKAPQNGVLVVAAHGAWHDIAKLKAKDAITAVNGAAIANTREFVDAVIKRQPQDSPVKLTVGSGSTEVEVLPPVAAKLETSGERLKDGPKHYRDWCASTSGPTLEELKADFAKRSNIWSELPFQSFDPQEIGGAKDFVRMAVGYIKVFLDDLFVAMGKYWTTALAYVASAALFALLPGLAGLIYRRAFWVWFGLAFVAFMAIRSVMSSAGQFLAHESDGDTAEAWAASIVVFVLSQLLVLLLVHRLRRHTAKPSLLATFVPVGLYDKVLRFGLVALGLGIAILGWGAELIKHIPFDQTWTKWNIILLGLPFLYFLLRVTPGWPDKKPKNIVVCLDGTSNTPDQLEMGLAAQTNVFKLFAMLKSDAGGSFVPTGRLDATLCKTYGDKQPGDKQIALYYTGIGNKYDSDPLLGTLEQATGLGASGIIERAYLDVMRVWRPGDRLFIFGFSRGAASARILARTIDQRGAPGSIWTLRLFGRHWTLWPSKKIAKVPVDVLGCWDTVGSFGVAKTIAGINFQQLNLLHNLAVPENVRQAYHMVALDESRQEFEPTLMDPDPIHLERIVEVFFPGDHAGVGGGWATDRLSDLPLDFLLRRISSGYSADRKSVPGDEGWGLYLAAVNALALDETGVPMTEEAERKAREAGVAVLHPDPLGQLRSFFSNVYNYRPRRLPLHAVISECVFERMTRSIPVYAPQALFDLNDALDEKRDLITAKVKKMEETRSMGDNEREKVLEFTDKLRLTRFPSYWSEVIAARKPDALPTIPSVVLANATI